MTVRTLSSPRRRCVLASLLLGLLAAAGRLPAAVPATLEGRGGLESLSLEELMKLSVTGVAGLQRARFTTPAAIHVLTGEAIRRSGHRTIAEALRMVPGMYVGRTDAQSWVVGARGLTGSALTSNRYLVLVDGRVAYDPLFSGTLWDTVDVLIEDVDRIEVIRGPGATLWGVNAMNGVIRVLTKRASQTLGTYAEVGSGDLEPLALALRHGGTLRPGVDFRLWGRYAERDAFELAAGGSAEDAWSTARAGFRIDGTRDEGAEWALLGGAYRHPRFQTRSRLPVPGQHRQFDSLLSDDRVEGADLLFYAGRGREAARGWRARTYYDYRDRQTAALGFRRDSIDAEIQRWSPWGDRHQLIWGAGAFHTADEIDDSPALRFAPATRTWTRFNAFLQDTIELVPGQWFAMLGSKLTYHELVDFEAQPGARLWWTPDERTIFWASVSRPVRVPSRLERDGFLVLAYVDPAIDAGGPPSGVIVPEGLAGDDGLDAERLVAWELGHRYQAGDDWVIDLAAFYNDYSDLVSVPPAVVGRWSNAGSGESYGFDLAASYQPNADWRLDASYSYLRVAIDGPVLELDEGATPEQMAQLRSYLDLGEELELNGALYWMDAVPRLGAPSYERLDLGLTWRPAPEWSLSLWGQNLLDAEHVEASQVAIPRSFFASVEARF